MVQLKIRWIRDEKNYFMHKKKKSTEINQAETKLLKINKRNENHKILAWNKMLIKMRIVLLNESN